ncbi:MULTISPECIES: CDP-glucose 4,6-dehydratase [unclassified Gilliamella]|uniref:CDP-glucose 4,6-dehydratase n=1 Tax=unclassified Gilliamella TaxID=2685620 RepID=UPI002269E61F|nr:MULTISPECIES: CDP-glucose 4,6-dehydratase [unclassified Gilliamella]MCX8583360.1 CDP-glucose 4,6-dehydratase [Gilliamella sp. B3372]MCX8593779.1 CDP-glucose 4,6-dehydratase [Gilliamella sp. B3367]
MFNNVYKNKVVLVTGHTGFKGSWLSIWLNMMGAKVVGYSLDPYSDRGNFNACHLSEKLFADIRGDVRDYDKLNNIFQTYKPEIVFHLAAQALVRTAYENPKDTYDINLMGSLNILEVSRHHDFVKQIIMITSDKCYENIEQIWGYKETDRMGGYDPYSASKGCAELMISSYRNSYFNPKDYHIHGKAIANVRAGNVIGGGDWSDNRLIPDCIRSIESNQNIEVRNPIATRPWEHVLEPLSGYLRVGEKLIEDPINYSTSFNFGPDISANKTVLEVVNRLVEYYGKGKVVNASDPNAVHENTLLNLDVTKAYVMLGWRAEWGLQEALEKTVDWYKTSLNNDDMYELCVKQILEHGDSIVK